MPDSVDTRLGRIEQKLDDFIEKQNGYVPKHCIENEGRIANLENAFKEWSKVKWAAIIAVIVMLVQSVPKALSYIGGK